MSEVLIYITCGDEKEAQSIGRTLVEERLAACSNVIGAMRSIYWWRGVLQEDREAILIAKTKRELVDSLSARVQKLHSYEMPCIVALPIIGGNPDFMQWIKDETITV